MGIIGDIGSTIGRGITNLMHMGGRQVKPLNARCNMVLTKPLFLLLIQGRLESPAQQLADTQFQTKYV